MQRNSSSCPSTVGGEGKITRSADGRRVQLIPESSDNVQISENSSTLRKVSEFGIVYWRLRSVLCTVLSNDCVAKKTRQSTFGYVCKSTKTTSVNEVLGKKCEQLTKCVQLITREVVSGVDFIA